MSRTGFLKRLFVSICLIVASIVSIGAAQLTSNDPYWLGDNATFGSTEGNDFWLTFMNNAMFDPSSPLNASITFELKVAISARQQTHVFIEAGNTVLERDVAANTTEIVDVSDLYALIYLLNSEVSNQYKGVHVYTDEPDKNFSCFSYSRNGEAGESSRDATLIIPTKFMGKEYFVQTYYEDTYSSEFAIVATEPGTVVHIWPAYATSGGIPAGQEIIVPLEQGAAYLLASAPHQGNNIRVDLSGSKICSNKPIAVFNGNQQTSIPFDESYSKDYLSEQILPISNWGTDFYLAKLGNTNKNYFILTSAYDYDTIFMKSYSTTAGENYDDTIVMMAGETLDPEFYYLDGDFKETTIHSTKPTMCYVYTTSAALNSQCTGSGRTQVCYNYGDPANALMPSWAHRTTSMNFFTHELDPFSQDPNKVPPQKFYVYLVAKWSERNVITIDGQTHASDFHQFMGDPEMAYASVEINNGPTPANKYHSVETTGEGFVGMVYAVTGAQGYLYTLGYTPDPFRDSLFVENLENIMVGGYDLPRIEQGWYQRQWNEWLKDHERLDTAQVCDSSIVKWMVQTPITKQTTPVEWKIYDVTDGATPSDATLISNYPVQQTTPAETTASDWIYRLEHQFILPDESTLSPEARTPFKEYEIHAILHYPHLICTSLPDETDTLKTTVRVTRIYHDTVYQYICMGDSYEFFNDSFPNQGDLTQKGTTKSVTTFIADKTDGESTTDYEWKARLGENIYDRAYQTIYGCDSTYTLYLFVCDTFRRVDTLHLCDNQSLVYEGEKFKGILSPDADGTIVTKDTVAIIYDKTTYCPCKQNPKYPAFQGCDSIFELHLMLHKTYRDTVIDTMCYNTKPDSLYRWPIQYNTRDSLISKNHPNMVFNDDLQAWVGFFSDTLQTQTCPECNNGNGCDSINILQLIIPKSYYYNDKDSICEWTYDRDTRTKIPNVYQWIHHRNGAGYVELPTSGTYYDSCVTRFGCDSIYTLELKYLKPFLKVDKHVMATNQIYKWHGVTYGPFLDEEFKNLEDGDTTLYFHNDNENQVHPVNGCDSIYRLELTLMDTYLFRSYRTICDYDSIHWRDSIIVGSKWQGTDPFDIRLKKTTTHVFDSLKTVELPVRDSVYQLTVTMRPSYEHFDTLYVCDNDSLEWEGQWYQGTGGTRDDERHYDTKYHCDSAFYLHLIVKPSYHFPVEDSLVCQNDPFVWTQHTQIIIPTDQPGEYFYYDSCLTTTCPACEGGGCDSIYTLHLVVNPIYDFYEEKDLCENDTLEWEGMLFVGSQYAAYGKTYDPAPYDSVRGPLAHGIHHENVYRHTVAGCDSIFHLTLNVHEVAHTDSLDSVCQGSPFFNPNWNWGQGRYMETGRVGTYTSVDTIHSVVTDCDSIVTLTLRVDSVYDYTQNLGAFCQDTVNTMREWIDDEGHSHGFVLDVSTTGLHTLGETHTTIHGCDSIYGVSWYVNPIYDFYEEKDLCENDTLEWEGMLFVGSQYAAYGKTYDPAPYDSVRGPLAHGIHHENVYRHTVAGCDSIFHLTLNVHEVAHTDSLDSVCQGSPFFNPNWNWGQGRYMETGRVGTYTSVDTIHSVVTDCDSIVTLTLRVDSVYDYTQNLGAFCQDTVNTMREWIDDEGHSHGFVLDVSTTGLHTLGETHTTIHGCDSIYGVSWYVNPIYDFYEEKDLCENDTLEWEGMLFVGSQYAAYGKTYDPAPYDSVRGPLAHGIHHENVYRHTVAGCDSIFHLTLNVHEVAHTDSLDSVCQGSPFFNPNWNWGQGRYMETGRVGTYTSVDTIHSVVTDCDSIVTLTLRVDSVYDYTQNLGAFCQDTVNTMREWIDDEGHSHGFVLDVSTTGLHTLGETHTTIHGCDSIYGVSWYVNPIYDFYEEKDLCENDTLEWEGMLFVGSQYAAYGKTYDPAPYDSVRGPLAHGIHHENVYRHTVAGCDSIFHLTLNVHEVAHTDSLDSVCQGSPFFNPNWNWGQGRYMETGRVGTYTSVDTIHSVVTDCDSIVTLTLRVDSVYNYTSQQVVCQEYGVDWIWYENGVPQDTISLDKGDTTYVLGRVYHTIHGCDSMYGKSVYVAPIYHIYDTVTLCSNDSLHWQGMLFTGDEYTNYGRTYVTSDFDSVKVNLAANEYDYAIRRGTAAYSCDSVHHLHLTVNAVGRETIERRACQSEGTYYYEHLNNGVGGYLNAAHLSDALTRKDTIQTALGCDSIITLNYFVDSVYNYTSQQLVCQEYNTDWIWYENGVPQDTISLDKGDTTYVLGRVYHTIHGCDSTYGKSVYVAPIYHIYDTLILCESDSLSWQGILFTGREFANYNPNGYDATHYRRVQTGLAGQADYYTDTAQYYTVHACDSVYHLALRVNTVYRASTERRVCQSEGTYFYEYLNNGVGGYLPAVHLSDALTRNDTMLTAFGCDSIVTLHYFVDSVYDYRQTQYVCQDTINSLWEWIDDEGHSHGFINIADSGNYSFDEPHTTIHGCDSTYGLILRVKPIYRFDSAYVICENERLVWQGRQYTGDSVHDATLNDSIFLTVGLHYDTAHYTTVEGCDSTYYVQIRVNPVFDTTSYMHTCYNETFVWHQQDIDGLYDDPMWDAQEMDTIFISAEMAVQQQIVRDTTMRYYERMLHTVNGCDSLSRLWLTIHPTYFFYTDTSVCANDVVEYRGKLFSHEDTTYTDTLHTAFGCDSIFQLHMHVRPAYLFHRYRDICDNETLYLEDNGLDIVWQPGDRIPGPRDYVEFPGKTREGCDSSYFYHVTVHPTHYFESYDTVCSSQLMLLQGSHYVGLDTIYDALTHQEPLDIVYTDSLHTSTCPYCENQVGCDSIYRIYAHILPQYYHLDRDTICDNEVLTWRAHIYEGLQPGDYITIDSLTTKAGCDSVYELRLHVAPTYYFEDHITKCADEDLTWRAHNLDHIEAGDHLIYDSLHTEYFGCDSVYHLYLTVLDTTFEIIYDTICRTESYDFHGRMLMEPGDYKDTTTNAWGCHHFTYLHLEVIEPTVPTAWADSICADDSAYELFYTYTGRDPIGYSVYYDEEGHYYGFVDQIDIPITTEEELHMLTLPMPFRGNDITNYPKPDYYNIRLVLDNGICTNPDLCATDTNIVLSYPSWLTQQRFGDVIALYNEKYNGGYYWDAYQWYHGDELLVGETHEYLYIPTGLIVGDQYHVRLTRVGETVDFQTCPITIVGDPIADDFAPQMGYLSVVPTCIVTGHPYANILSRKDGTYRISNSNGLLVSEGVFRADVTQVELPAVPGMYIFQLWSADTPEEPYRSIKVIVKEVCENCNMPF